MSKECAECEDIIPEARLKLVPDAEFCVFCQELMEKKGLFQKTTMNVIAKANGGGEVEELIPIIHKGSKV